MLHKMDIHDCLIFLENQGLTEADIQERMGLHRTTISRWWKTNNPSPKLLAKMRKWCGEFIPIEDHFYGKKPPENIFHEAVTNAYYELENDGDKRHESTHPWSILRIGYYHHKMMWPNYYDRGIPAASSRAMAMRCPYRGTYRTDPPKIEHIQQIIADYHPDRRIKEYFMKLIDH